MTKAIDGVTSKLATLQTPDQIIEIKPSPVMSALTRAINSFNKSAEVQAQTIEANLQQTQAVGAAVVRLMQEIRTAEAARAADEALRSR
ncbi:hypothetical protein ACKWRH_33350 [Bradyrhizobium sp. Pa8]|uniref:hypothetical protein n=1 Tax=Bradyrhizobium sp. Pa8 TaxID=3386552 RepID=UPI00403F9D5D